MSTLITGATGFVGRKFVDRTSADRIVVACRNVEKAKSIFGSKVDQFVRWRNAREDLDLTSETGPIDQVVNLMGESIAEGRWTKAKKKRIRDSRILGTRRLVDALVATGRPPRVFVSASAIGIYGDSGEKLVTEEGPLDSGFTGSVCHEWEQEAMRLNEFGTRVVCLRIGIVLGNDGGALEKMLPIFRLGIGGKLGSGKQWMAWIHVEDLVSLIEWCLSSEIEGPVNATAPHPVRNEEFTQKLASTLKRSAFLPAPWFALRLALGEFANTLFFSQRVIPAAATQHGFEFKFPEIETALADAVHGHITSPRSN
jgi:uncharacterized protein (TIGR01777 family)